MILDFLSYQLKHLTLTLFSIKGPFTGQFCLQIKGSNSITFIDVFLKKLQNLHKGYWPIYEYKKSTDRL